jgi:hypothetical protein
MSLRREMIEVLAGDGQFFTVDRAAKNGDVKLAIS